MGKDFRKQRGRKIEEVVFPLPDSLHNIPEWYADFITQVKERITHERIKTVLSANAALIVLYWEIGARILDRQQSEGWGAKVIDRMSYDLKGDFPEMQGFSPRNLKYMRKFAEAWPDIELVQRTVALIPWRSNIALLDKLDDQETRLWYAHKTLELGLKTEIANIF